MKKLTDKQLEKRTRQLEQEIEEINGFLAMVNRIADETGRYPEGCCRCPECNRIARITRSVKVDNLYLKTLKCGHKIIKRDNRV